MTGGNGYQKTKELEGFLQDEKDVATHVGTIVIHTSERASQLLLLDGVMEEVEKSVTTINMVREGAAPFFKPSRAGLPLRTLRRQVLREGTSTLFFLENTNATMSTIHFSSVTIQTGNSSLIVDGYSSLIEGGNQCSYQIKLVSHDKGNLWNGRSLS